MGPGRPPTYLSDLPPRRVLLLAGLEFVRGVVKVAGVREVALIGSMTTAKESPKDIDFVVTVGRDVAWEDLARVTRRLKGTALSGGCGGADVFLAGDGGRYLGRVCSYRKQRYRRACGAFRCGEAPYLCDDSALMRLARGTILEPPVHLWPAVQRRQALPADVEELLVARLDWAG